MTDVEQEAGHVLLVRGDGRILAINAEGDRLDWRIPGGLRGDEDESIAHAASRHLAEQTGVFIFHTVLQPVFAVDGGTYSEVTYMPKSMDPVAWPGELASTPYMGDVDWVDPAWLMWSTSKRGPYHVRLLEAMGYDKLKE
jgi:hypothetical protein